MAGLDDRIAVVNVDVNLRGVRRHITGAAVPVDGGITAQVYPQVYAQAIV